MALTKKLEAVADSIRSKTGSTEKMTLDEMATTINKDLVTAADNDPKVLLDKFIKNELTEYENDEVTAVPSYAFYNKTNLQKISLPNVTEVGDYSLQYTNNLKSLTLGKINKVEDYAFAYTNTWNQDFIGFWEFPYLNYCTLKAFDDSGFKGVGLPYTETKNSGEGAGSSKIQWVYISETYGNKLGGTYYFYSVMNKAYAKGLVLDSVVPPTLNYLVDVSHTDSKNPFYNGKAKIYVPREGLEAYSTATNWSIYYEAGNILAIEDNQSTLEGMFPSLDAKYFDTFDWDSATLQEKFEKTLGYELWALNTKISYAEIAEIAADLEANTTSSVYYQYKDALLGKRMTVEIGGVTCSATIVGVLQDVDENDNPLAFTFWITKNIGIFNPLLYKPLNYTSYKMNNTSTNVGGWGATEMRRWLNEEQLPTLSCAEYVKPAKKYYGPDCFSTSTDVSNTLDSLFLLSDKELCNINNPIILSGSNNRPFWQYEGTGASHNEQYQLFANENITFDNYSKLTCSTYCWLRTCRYNGSGIFMSVNTNGNPCYYNHASSSYGVAPAFCI